MQVRFENVTMQFEQKRVLDDINFTLPSGELISFLGPSGCGKSTTLYLISGLLNPSSGKIYFDDQDVTKLDPVKRGVGLVFQNYALYPHLTVLENIMFPLKMAKVTKNERVEIAKEMAALTQIEDQLDKYPRQLSGGQQQRVAISRALAKSPKILLMDEPLSNLDARLRIEMRDEIRRIQQKTGVTTVFVTHDQEEALSIADKVMVLNQGAIQQKTDPVTLYKEPANLFVAKFIGTPVINTFTRTSSVFNPDTWFMKESWTTVGIRSEHFKVGSASDYDVEARVERLEQVGKDVTLHLVAGEDHFLVSDLAFEVQVGEELYLKVPADKLLFFDDITQRIEVGSNE